ncbi:MAG: monovalent cation/H(+) antiporter subunit G [Anaerolineae bacterium]|jgi:multicomponent Na+:H+ antiporter subunit G|nr:monovalent cation/H(+) antiporter subunit G [Anaerolineae bacterium]
MTLSEILALLALSAGTFFSVVGIVGMVRLPDVYSRAHASGKVSTLGIIGLLAGASLLMPEVTLKALALAVFLVITAPVASHAIAAAAHRQGVPRAGAVRDDLGRHADGEGQLIE